MPIPKNKSELLSAINTAYDKLKKEVVDIPIALTTIVELEGHAKGTQISIENLLAYLIGWGELLLKWQDKKEKGEEVVFPEEGYKWNELGLLAQKSYKDYGAEDFEKLQKKLEQTVQRILELVAKTEEQDLYERPWYGKYPLGRMIQLNTSSPYKNARSRIRKWKKVRRE
ncbi:MAG: hypothetical protein ACI8YQ_001471 [Polaribacter sp.]|jgi:hypothetical protein